MDSVLFLRFLPLLFSFDITIKIVICDKIRKQVFLSRTRNTEIGLNLEGCIRIENNDAPEDAGNGAGQAYFGRHQTLGLI